MVTDERTRSAADMYAATFSGREDVYSVWGGDHWKAIRQPLTGDIVLRAFTTGIPISAYLLAPDSMTHLACLDIDRDDGLDLGKRFLRTLDSVGGQGYLEPSRRGCHVWMVLDERRPALLVRRALRTLVLEAGIGECPGAGQASVLNPKTERPMCPECLRPVDESNHLEKHLDPRVELRPGSDRLPEPVEGEPPRLGHCIRMPTMPHQRTGKRYVLFASGTGQRLPGTLAEMMLEIETCSTAPIDEAAERAPLPPLGAPPPALRYPYGDPPVTESASDILTQLWGAVNARPGKAIKCPAHADRRPSLSILKDDQRAVCHTPGCILNNDGRGRGTRELRALAPGSHQ